jgi:hypothetical protein
MKYNYLDALILNSIVNSEKEDFGAELSDIIAYADYVDHAIIALSELNNSIEKLLLDGLIVTLDNKNLFVNVIYKSWLNKKLEGKSKFSILKIVEETEKFLINYRKDNNANDEFKKIVLLQESEYLEAVERYLSR